VCLELELGTLNDRRGREEASGAQHAREEFNNHSRQTPHNLPPDDVTLLCATTIAYTTYPTTMNQNPQDDADRVRELSVFTLTFS
jgi:hypothetical protein